MFDDGTGPALYAGGRFTSAGGSSGNHIAKWDGSAWSALGSGLDSPASTMVVHDNGDGPALYVGGSFSTAGGISTANVAAWDGATWSAVLTSANGGVSALASHDDGNGPELWLGGGFTIVNEHAATHITKWSCTCDCDTSLTAAQWALIGLPCSSAATTVLDVLGDDLDPADYGTRWAVVARNEDTNSYYQLTLGDSLVQGEGYWLKSLDDAAIDAGGAPTATLCSATSEYGQCFDIALEGSAGRTANLVGHPFSSPVPWADARFVDGSGVEYTPAQAEVAGIAERTMYLWNGSAYEPYDGETPGMKGTLSAFSGMWVYANQDLTLRVPTAAELASKREEGPFPIPMTQPDTGQLLPGEWYVRVIVSADEMRDPRNVLGQLTDSVADKDRHDLEEIAPFGARYLTVVFPHPDWPAGGNYASDFHAVATGQVDSWHFEVQSDDPQRTVTLSFEEPPEILSTAELVDEVTGVVYPALSNPTFTMGASERGFTFNARPLDAGIFSDGFETGDTARWDGER